jgi:DNA-binding transcriptional ArsR family regulator
MADELLLQELAQFFKTLADENRLKIAGLAASGEYRVSDLAQELGLTEPTVSHHVTKLRGAGLLNLNQVGTNRYYRLNAAMLATMLDHAAHLEAIVRKTPQPRPDMSWVDDLDLDEQDRKVLRDYCVGQRLKQIPAKEKKLVAVLRWLATRFEPGVQYSEREVNAIIEQVHPDYATLRRELVDFHFLEREGGGGSYWRAAGE